MAVRQCAVSGRLFCGAGGGAAGRAAAEVELLQEGAGEAGPVRQPREGRHCQLGGPGRAVGGES